jgi:hypothetical protein
MSTMNSQKVLPKTPVSLTKQCAALAALTLCAATAVAQQRPAYGTQNGVQRGGQMPNQQQQQQQMQSTAPIPPVDATPLTEANTAVTKAKAELKKAQGVLFGASKRFEKTIDAKPDVQASTSQLSASQTMLQSQTATVMVKLKTDPAYSEAQTKATAAKTDVETLRGNPDATPEQRYAAVQAALAANQAVSKIILAAMDADPKIAADKAKVAADNDAVQKLRTKYRADMKDDAEWTAANKDVADKQASVEAANKQLADAKKTVADRQAAYAAAVAAQRKQEADNAARNGGYGLPAGIPAGAPTGR